MLNIQEITDAILWERFCVKYGNWSLFQSFAWGEIQKKIGHVIIRYGLFSSNQLDAIAQIEVVHARRGKFLHVRQGPVFKNPDPENIDAVLTQFLPKIVEIAKRYQAWFIRLSPMLQESRYEKIFSNYLFKPAPIPALDAEICWILELNEKFEDILGHMRKTTRYLIHKAENLGVKITESDRIKEFLELYYQTAKRQKFIPHKGILEEFNFFREKKQMIYLRGEFQGQLIAGALILFYGNQAIYHHGASVFSKIPVSYLLQWRAIQIAKERNCQIYNFWGVAPENQSSHPWMGITLFKKGFGGRYMHFMHAQDLPLKTNYLFTRFIENIRKIRRGY